MCSFGSHFAQGVKFPQFLSPLELIGYGTDNMVGSRANLQKIATADQSLRIDRDIIHSVASVRDLGVTSCQQSRQCVFLSHSSSEADLPAAWTWRCDQSCFCVHVE